MLLKYNGAMARYILSLLLLVFAVSCGSNSSSKSEGTVECSECDGEGYIIAWCPSCDGEGYMNCEECDGNGKVKATCPECEGDGKI